MHRHSHRGLEPGQGFHMIPRGGLYIATSPQQRPKGEEHEPVEGVAYAPQPPTARVEV